MLCEKCEKRVPKGYLICPSCRHVLGSAFEAAVPQVATAPSFQTKSLSPNTQPTPQLKVPPLYAGFWIRLGAHLIDQVILLALYFSLFLFFSVAAQQNGAPLALAVYAVVALFYEGYFTSRKWYATPGKKALKLQVFDEALHPLTFGVAMGRSFLKYVSAITFGIGYIMVAFTTKKQGLHDLMVRTVVIRN